MSDFARLDAETLLALSSHPLRPRLLFQLRLRGPATATRLAQDLGTNSGATSYHLRRLAEVGLVVETDEGQGRERWWKAAHEGHSWFPSDLVHDEHGEAVITVLRSAQMRRFTELTQRLLDREHGWPPEWRDLAGASDYFLQLTAQQLGELLEELDAVIARYRHLDAAPGAERVNLYLHVLPEDDPS
jgi:predicted ArsR family transcriptional regulator